MSIMKGNLAHSTYTIKADISATELHAALAAHAFDDDAPTGVAADEPDLVTQGWTKLADPSETTLEYTTVSPSPGLLVASLRTDKKAISSTYYKICVAKAVRNYKEAHEVTSVPSAARKEIREQVKANLIKRALPKVSTLDVLITDAKWQNAEQNPATRTLYVFGSSASQVGAALSYLQATIDSVSDATIERKSLITEQLEKATKSTARELGSDFLSWIWRVSEDASEGRLECLLHVVDRLTLKSDTDGSSTIHVGDKPGTGEIVKLDRGSKQPVSLKVVMALGEEGESFTFGLEAVDDGGIAVTRMLASVKPEKGTEWADAVVERGLVFQKGLDELDKLVKLFEGDRVSDEWESTHTSWKVDPE